MTGSVGRRHALGEPPSRTGAGAQVQVRVEGPPGERVGENAEGRVAERAEERAMTRAIELAQTPGVPLGPNPRVGCVLVDADGETVAEGFHRGAGTAHAEVDALSRAGDRARGATAVVTLEPCNHTGRTGACAQALVAAGVVRVVFAQGDPNHVAAGGAQTLRSAGVDVAGGLLVDAARAVNRVWTFAVEHGRPYVTWKLATSLDGRSAAADGSSRWITSAAARADAHRLRARCDVVLAGTGTVLADDPELTARDAAGNNLPQQPLRAVMGLRAVPPSARVLDDSADTVLLKTRDPDAALEQLFADDRQHVFFEGGPTLAAAFLAADLVDEVVVYIAPMLLGAGIPAVADLGIATIADALHLTVRDIAVIGDGADRNVRITAVTSFGQSPPTAQTPPTERAEPAERAEQTEQTERAEQAEQTERDEV